MLLAGQLFLASPVYERVPTAQTYMHWVLAVKREEVSGEYAAAAAAAAASLRISG